MSLRDTVQEWSHTLPAERKPACAALHYPPPGLESATPTEEAMHREILDLLGQLSAMKTKKHQGSNGLVDVEAAFLQQDSFASASATLEDAMQAPQTSHAPQGQRGNGGTVPVASSHPGDLSSRKVLDPKRVRSRNVTTLMLSNLDTRTTTSAGIKNDLDACGFEDRYDFIYVPHSIARLEAIGYAFVNFCSPEAAADFVIFYGATKHSANLQVAREQGLERLIALCIRRGLHKLRNIKYRPWLKEPNLLAAARHG
mmetsp:Transcript_70993/g.170062  ORF Transcript_70993/g.170062 Transcript_70993/m.170062 type:complete len:256 (-) Transcript_70993:143-910(-)